MRDQKVRVGTWVDGRTLWTMNFELVDLNIERAGDWSCSSGA